MAKTVVGLFDRFEEAQRVISDLVDRGFRREDISVMANNSRGELSQYGAEGHTGTAEAAGAGAVGGSVIGGVLGLLIGTGLLVIPGIGPVLAAGPLAAALGSAAVGAGIGAAAGGLVGALVGAGVPEEEANYYAEGVRRGGTLITVTASDDMAEIAYDIMQRHGAADINERGATYRAGGWSRFDPEGQPYRGDDARTDWEESSKLGTAAGTAAGAATGAAIGSAGGPVGTVVGGVAGAAVGAGTGAAGDVAGEKAEDSGAFRGDDRSRAVGQRRFEDMDTDFRSHYRSNFGTGDYPYERYSSVYRYGYDLGTNPSYSNAEWSTLEPEVRRRWETERHGTWEQFKDAVQYAWNRVRGR